MRKYVILLVLLIVFLLPSQNLIVKAQNPFSEGSFWLTFDKIGNIVNLFEKLEYVFIDVSTEFRVNYEHHGLEEFPEGELNKVSMQSSIGEVDSEEVEVMQKMTFLIHEEGNVVRLINDLNQDELPPFYADVIMKGFLVPFHAIQHLDIETTLIDGTGQVQHIGSDEETIGEEKVKIHTFQIELTGEDGSYAGQGTFQVGDFGDFLMLVRYQIPRNGQDLFIEYKVNKLKLR